MWLPLVFLAGGSLMGSLELSENLAPVLSDGEDGAKSGVASTVVDCTQDHPVIVREGAITIADIKSLS